MPAKDELRARVVNPSAAPVAVGAVSGAVRAMGRDAQLGLLIVDSDEAVRDALERAAEESERFWSIRSMADGRFALEHIWQCIERDRKTLPDVVVLNPHLTGLSGAQLTRELRRYDETRSLFVACLASRAEPREQDAAENAGCDFFQRRDEDAAALQKIFRSIANRCVAKATCPARILN